MESQVKIHVLNHNLSLFVRYMPGHLETMFTDTGFKLYIKGKKIPSVKKNNDEGYIQDTYRFSIHL